MTLRHLKIFITVADLGSMTAASKALYIAQPTVSQAISELEEYYGVKLFDRLSKRLYITETGIQLLSYARHIIDLLDEMEKTIKDTENSGIIKIGASVTIGTCLLPKLVNKFNTIYPSITVNAITKNTTDIENLINHNTIDFAVVEGIVHTADIISIPFMDDELVMVCGKDHPLYNSEEISPADIGGLTFIMREQGSGTRELFESIMAANDIKWQLGWEYNGSDGLKSAAVSGIGVAVISKLLVEEELKTGKLSILKIRGIDFKRKFSIIYHKNKYLTKTMKTFMNIIKNT